MLPDELMPSPEQEQEQLSRSLMVAPVPALPELSTAISEEDFAASLEKLVMWTSYTGPVPSTFDDLVNTTFEVKGCIMQKLTHSNEETGEYKEWWEARFKLSDDHIVSASGKASRQFAATLCQFFGQGDFPRPVKVSLRTRTLSNGHRMPTFQLLG